MSEKRDRLRFRDTLPEMFVQLSLYVAFCPPVAVSVTGNRA
jgi:hypothetical protein